MRFTKMLCALAMLALPENSRFPLHRWWTTVHLRPFRSSSSPCCPPGSIIPVPYINPLESSFFKASTPFYMFAYCFVIRSFITSSIWQLPHRKTLYLSSDRLSVTDCNPTVRYDLVLFSINKQWSLVFMQKIEPFHYVGVVRVIHLKKLLLLHEPLML